MANLLDQASIILTPTAYDNGKVLCAKPSEPPYGDFDFSRNSAATRVNAQGLVENVQILSSNLVQNGDFSEEGVQEVSNGSFSQEGSEELANSDFTNGLTSWSGGTGNTVVNNQLIANSTGLFYQPLELTTNKTYKAVINIDSISQGGVKFYCQGNQSETIATSGVHTIYIVSGSSNSLVGINPIGTFEAVVNSISFREVGQDWVLETGWSIGEDKAIQDGTGSGNNGDIYQNLGLDTSKTYKLVLEVADYTQGTLYIDTNNTDLNVNGVGTYTLYFTPLSSFLYIRTRFSGFIGSITNISVKEVGQNWNLGTDWGIGNNKAIRTGTSSSGLTQSDSFGNGKKYRLKFTISDFVSGSIKGEFSGGGGSDVFFNKSNIGNGTFTFETTTTTNRTLLQFYAFSSFQGSITNISVIEITDDTNLPRINYEGFSYQDALGSELITNGSFDNGLNGWSSVNTTVVDGRAYVDASSDNNGYLKWNTALISGKFYKITFDLEIVQGSMNFENWGGSINKQYTGSQTITDTLVFEMDGSENKFLFGRNGIYSPRAIFYIDNVSVKEITGQEVVPDSGCGSWLFEPQSTNLARYSEDFSQYSTGNIPIVTGGFLAPDGTNNAYKITDSGSSTVYRGGLNVSSTATRSIYARSVSGTGTATLMSYFGNTNNVFTLTEDWQRFEVNGTTVVPGEDNFYAADFRGSGTLTEYLVWGAQAEALSYATSYIPTSGSTVTRNQDVCTNGGSLASINSTEGVLYFESSALSENTGTFRTIALSDGTTNNRVLVSYTDAANTIRVLVFRNNGLQVIMDRTITAKDNNKIAVKYELNEVDFWINGVKVGTDTNAFMPIGLNELSFSRGDGDLNFFGKTKAVAVWKEALSDQELADLTYPTPTDPTFALDFDTIATDFTFARGSEATYVDAQGLIQSTNEIGEELITNGDFSNGSTDWQTEGFSSIVVGDFKGKTDVAKININNASTNSRIRQPFNYVSGKTYKVDIEVYVQSGNFRADGSDSFVSGDFVSTSTLGSWQTLTANVTAISTGLNYIWLRPISGVSEFYVSNVSVKEYITATNTPRLDYSTGAEAFLLEPQSTNFVTYSEDFSQWATVGTPTITSNYGISPDGTQNSTRIQFDANERIYFILSASGNITFSVYLKGSGVLTLRDNTNGYRQDVTLTSEWTRYDLSFNATITSIQIQNQTASIVDCEIWGAQLEEQTYVTSYIPTSGSSVTRNQETCINATPEINSEEGVLYAEIAALTKINPSGNITLSDGTGNNRIYIYYLIDNSISVIYNVNSTGASINNFSLANITDQTKMAVRWGNSNVSVWINGASVLSNTTSNFLPNTLNVLSFAKPSGGVPFEGRTKDIQVYTKALSDAELIKLTT